VTTVLLADDDPTVTSVLGEYLQQAQLDSVSAQNGTEAWLIIERQPIALAIVDIMMGPPTGLELCRQLRANPRTAHIPIMLLSALDQEHDKIGGFEGGADDYVTKPFSPREVILRAQALLRRSAPPSNAEPVQRKSADLLLDNTARSLHRGNKLVPLTAREHDLLAFFLQHPGQAFSRTVLLQRVWGWSFGDESTVTVHVRRLREKIEPDPGCPTRLITVWGSGYRWDADVC
jgi:DNA-binding response OmpR family regulator